MKLIGLFVWILTLHFASARAQAPADSAWHFYLGNNQISSDLNFKRLDSLLLQLKAKTINLRIYGFADYTYNTAYNQQLSQKRADAIRKYIINNYIYVNVLSCLAYGENFSKDDGTNKGEASQRRVDVVIQRLVAKNEVDTRPVIVEPLKENTIENTPTTNISKLEKGSRLVLEGLSFEPGRHYMLKSSLRILENLLASLKQHPELKIEIQGHVCCTDGGLDSFDYDSRDQLLSLHRAKAVYDYLVKNGINASRLSYKGLGHSKPVVNPELTPADEQRNRRVEIEVLDTP